MNAGHFNVSGDTCLQFQTYTERGINAQTVCCLDMNFVCPVLFPLSGSLVIGL